MKDSRESPVLGQSKIKPEDYLLFFITFKCRRRVISVTILKYAKYLFKLKDVSSCSNKPLEDLFLQVDTRFGFWVHSDTETKQWLTLYQRKSGHYWQELDGFNSHHPAFVHFNLTGPVEKFQQHPNKDWKATNRTRGHWVRSKNATSVP